MTPRFLVVCLGGLAGAGALVCCDMDEGVETAPDVLDEPSAEEPVAEVEVTEAVVH
jgi:hypothetical protein